MQQSTSDIDTFAAGSYILIDAAVQQF